MAAPPRVGSWQPDSMGETAGWSGRTVRERVGVLKGLGNIGAAILSGGLDPPLTRLPGEGKNEVHHSGHNEDTTGAALLAEVPPVNLSLLPMGEGGA